MDVTQAHKEKVEHENRLDKNIKFFNLPTKYRREQCFASGRELFKVTQSHEEKIDHENRLDKSIVFVNLPTYMDGSRVLQARGED